jgi:hypothetical protein
MDLTSSKPSNCLFMGDEIDGWACRLGYCGMWNEYTGLTLELYSDSQQLWTRNNSDGQHDVRHRPCATTATIPALQWTQKRKKRIMMVCWYIKKKSSDQVQPVPAGPALQKALSARSVPLGSMHHTWSRLEVVGFTRRPLVVPVVGWISVRSGRGKCEMGLLWVVGR